MRFCLSIIVSVLTFLVTLSSCENHDEMELKEKLDSIAVAKSTTVKGVDKATIIDYVDKEKSINKKYVEGLQHLVESDFEEKVEDFEDEELGFFNSYKHMFHVIVDSDDDLQDYWSLKCTKHFSSLPTEGKMHELYLSYANDIKTLRTQVSSAKQASSNLSAQVKIDIPQEDINLSGMIGHSYTNLLIEFGIDIAVWLLGLLVVEIITLIVGTFTGGWGWIGTIISVIASIILSIYNDNKMLDSIREQHTQSVKFDYKSMLNDLDAKTISFYEAL